MASLVDSVADFAGDVIGDTALESVLGGSPPGARSGRPTTRPCPWPLAAGAAALSGVLLGACFRPFNWYPLAWVALVPFLLVLPRLSAGRTWLYGGLLGLVYYRIALDWGFGISGLLALGFLATFSVWMGFVLRVVRLLMGHFGTGAMLWAVPLAITGAEVLRCEGLPRLRFGFTAIGYSQVHLPPVAQIASLIGVYGITFAVTAFNAALACAMLRRGGRARGYLALIMLLIFGAILLASPGDVAPGDVPVAAIQVEDANNDELLDMTREAVQHPSRPRLIVLPEHSATVLRSGRDPLLTGLTDIAREHNATIAIGVDRGAQASAASTYDNLALIIGPDGMIGEQLKAVPIPFFQDGNPAERQAVFDTPAGGLGVCVCYDATFTDIPRRLTAMGAELLIVPVMDPKPWPAQERWQHADLAPLRAIENRRWIIRAASSGISQIIDPNGKVVAMRTESEGPGILFGRVSATRERSPFVQIGWLFAPAVGIGFLVAVAALTLSEWRGTRRTSREQAGGTAQ